MFSRRELLKTIVLAPVVNLFVKGKSLHQVKVETLIELLTEYRNIVARGSADSEQLFLLIDKIESVSLSFCAFDDELESVFERLTGRSYEVAQFAYLIPLPDEGLEYWQSELDKSDYNEADRTYLQGIIDSYEEVAE